jgi:uroporphyrinogen-III decarboxylase
MIVTSPFSFCFRPRSSLMIDGPMTHEQWDKLLAVLGGEVFDPLPVGFIIDSPWLPGWAGMSILDYYSSERKWLEANLQAMRTFPEAMFLPGFWSEFGMCTEPSAFGTKCRWHEEELPYADKIIRSIEDVDRIEKPDVKTDGLLPFVIRRLGLNQEAIQEKGHAIRFAVARGPLNIASFLMGTTEFMMALYTDPEPMRRLLTVVTDFLVEWVQYQKECFPSIDGIFVLDDIVGFIGEPDFRQWAMPYLKRVFGSIDAKVRFFHNDAQGLVCAPFLQEIGINLFNFSFEHSIQEMKELTGGKVTLLGNIPPRDVLAQGTPEDVASAVKASVEPVADRSRIILSCGGGVPPQVSTENLRAFLKTVRQFNVF